MSTALNMNDSYYILDTFYERNWYQKYAHEYIIYSTLSQPLNNQMGYLFCLMLVTWKLTKFDCDAFYL